MNIFFSKSTARAAMTLLVTLFCTLPAWAAFTPASGSGTSTDPYVISTTDQWNSLCQSYSDGIMTNGLFYQLGNDIYVSTMLGTDSHPFVGTFDGTGHTLTFTLETTGEYAAPFRYVNGATISNLYTSGSITTSAKFAGGIVGLARDANTITSCYSDISITSSVNGDGTHGGLVSNIQDGSFVIEGCVFSGKLTGSTTKNCGGFVGFTGGGKKLTIKNSLFAPGELSTMEGTQTFARYYEVNDVTIKNSYYTQTFGTAQGTQAYAYTTLPAGTSMGDKVAEYRWSTAYANGIYFNNVYYNKSDSTAKVVLSSDGETLTFYYDTNTYTDSYALNTGTNSPAWRGNTSITTVVFDASFQHARPTTTYQWFDGLSNLATINDIKYLNTSMVENMAAMFNGCSQLSSLDLSGFNTAQVENMFFMFNGCSSLTALDLSKFNTAQVKNMNYMFEGCSKLTTLDLSGFNTEQVEDMCFMFNGCSSLTALDLSKFNTTQVKNMSDMFRDCSKLTTLDLSGFNTGSVTNMGSMFNNCSRLTTLDLSSFNTEQVEDMSSMFEGCSNLKTILASGDFTINNLREGNAEEGIPDGGVDMFYDCTSLVGGNGTTTTDNPIDATYARIDTEDTPGYFTNKAACVAKAELSSDGKTLTFYYGTSAQMPKDSQLYDLNTGTNSPAWRGNTSITTVVFDGTFQHARPTTTYQWFEGLSSLATITDIKYLNTSMVENMAAMFNGCSQLTSLDVSGFNTTNVTNMSSMFYGCSHLSTLDLSKFNTGSVTNMSSMFYGCSQLSTLLASSSFVTTEVTSSTDMFTGCTSLVGGKLTPYYANHTDATYARIDGGPSSDTPGYFTDNASTAKVVLSGETLTFYYDTNTYTDSYALNTGTNSPAWRGNTSITTVVFDASFQHARPTTTYQWFEGLSSLATITDIKYLNTSMAENMAAMFNGCSQLSSLDLSGFNTEKVEDMSFMFEGCSKLTSLDVGSFSTEQVGDMYSMFSGCSSLTTLDLSGFNTEKVEDMSFMFTGCSSLTTLDLSGFNTAQVGGISDMFRGCSKLTTLDLSGFNTGSVTNMGSMFSGCSKLTTLDLSGFNTAQVENMSFMFNGCSKLTSLDLSGFNTEQVEDMSSMFNGCSNLKTILADNDFTLKEGLLSDDMFSDCSKLVGGNGTTTTDNPIDATYARIDTEDTPGYFTNKAACVAKAELSSDGKTLTFYYGTSAQMPEDSQLYDLNTGTNSPAWRGNTSITTVVFDASFQHARPTTTYQWFEGLSSLATITDIKYLNTSMVENMAAMFNGCSQLSSLDVGSFSTANVMKMAYMFAGCSKLTSLDVSGFDTRKVEDMCYMFNGCSQLTSLDLSKFNTTQVKNMAAMFSGCSQLTTLDLSGFNTEKVGYMRYMFNGCSKLTTLDLSGFNTGSVTNMGNMFYGCSKLTSLDLSGFNTEKVENMGSMFKNCSRLTTLDLSSFNTEQVEDMSSMFEGCSNLKTILASGDFTINNLREGNAEEGIPEGGLCMFYGCKSLVGGNGTACDGVNNTDKAYARIDGGESNPGYFTAIITLTNDKDNTEVIASNTGENKFLLLSGRTLYRDGYWNTICLPFNVSDGDANDDKTFTGTPLEGATAMTLNSASFDEETGTLTLGFKSVTELASGTPYIIKWEDSDNSLKDLGNPVFWNVTVAGTDLTTITKGDETNGNLITFTGTYGYQKFTDTDRSILFMGAGNTLYYPTAGAEIGACRAYFKLEGDLTAGDPKQNIKAFVLNFDEESESNGISTVDTEASAADGWYTLDGRRLLEKPVQKGMYIHDGHKVLLK